MEERKLDSLLVALADPRRRRVCRYLAGTNGSAVPLRELAAAVDTDAPIEPAAPTVGTSARTTVRTTLHHVHLPKLDDAAVVEYTPEGESVRTDVAFPAALELLGTVEVLESVPESDLNHEFGR